MTRMGYTNDGSMRAVAFARSFPVWQPPTLPAPPPTRLGLPSRPDTRVGKPFARPVGYDDDDSTPRQDGKIPRPPFFGGACFPIPARPREGRERIILFRKQNVQNSEHDRKSRMNNLFSRDFHCFAIDFFKI